MGMTLASVLPRDFRLLFRPRLRRHVRRYRELERELEAIVRSGCDEAPDGEVLLKEMRLLRHACVALLHGDEARFWEVVGS